MITATTTIQRTIISCIANKLQMDCYIGFQCKHFG